MSDRRRGDPDDPPADPTQDRSEPFAGDSPRWRQVPMEHRSSASRRAHQSPAHPEEKTGAIDREPPEVSGTDRHVGAEVDHDVPPGS
jgi:hypothetical protein